MRSAPEKAAEEEDRMTPFDYPLLAFLMLVAASPVLQGAIVAGVVAYCIYRWRRFHVRITKDPLA
jgi:uncharacterized membrane protein YoaT (DUF817 family)